MSAGYPAYSPLIPNLHVYLPLKKNVSFLMIDTASKDVLQKSGLSSMAGILGRSGRLGGIILLVVVTVVGVVAAVVVVEMGVVVEMVVVVVVNLVLIVVVGVGRSGLWEDGLYTGMSPHILSFFEPIKKTQIAFNIFCELYYNY